MLYADCMSQRGLASCLHQWKHDIYILVCTHHSSFRMGYAHPPLVQQGNAPRDLHAEPVNTCNEEWRIRKAKRTVTMAAYEDEWPFACALASLLISHGDGVDLTHHAKTRKRKVRQPSKDTVVLWPVAENRNVSKRMWESQALAAKHCLKGNTMLYFRFWLLCTQPSNYIVG